MSPRRVSAALVQVLRQAFPGVMLVDDVAAVQSLPRVRDMQARRCPLTLPPLPRPPARRRPLAAPRMTYPHRVRHSRFTGHRAARCRLPLRGRFQGGAAGRDGRGGHWAGAPRLPAVAPGQGRRASGAVGAAGKCEAQVYNAPRIPANPCGHDAKPSCERPPTPSRIRPRSTCPTHTRQTMLGCRWRRFWTGTERRRP